MATEERHSRPSEELPGLDRVPVETHFLEPLDRLIDHPIVLARDTKRTKSERLEVRPRPQERRCLLLDLRASLESDKRVEARDEAFHVPKAANRGAPLAQLPLNLCQVASSDRNLDVQRVECVA